MLLQEGDFVSFIQGQTNVQQSSEKVMTAQKAGFGINVHMTGDSDFQEVISAANPIFVMFYASCKF